MNSYLICCTPAHGHVLPLLTVGRHLAGQGHRVRFLTGAAYRDRVEAAGLTFVPLPAEADVDLDHAGDLPERAGLKGPAAIRFDLRHLFIAPGRAQFAALRDQLALERADAVLTEGLFLGAALLNQLPREQRPPVVVLGIFPLGAASRDTAPFGLGVPPMPGAMGRLRNRLLTLLSEKVVFGPVIAEVDAVARELTGSPMTGSFFDWPSHSDAEIQFTVPSFEYPRSDLPAVVHFAGPLPLAASGVALPEWWDELDGSRPVVHVTQGTVANADPGLLIRPTLQGLADRDVLVVISTGGRDVAALGELPGNARAASYLPYDKLFDKLDVLVSNGGYGTVQYALAHGVPLVVAGQTEDKIEVTARVGWSGAGINLRTNAAEANAIARAVDRVLSDPGYRARAERIGQDIAGSDALLTLTRVLRSVELLPSA